MNLQGKKYSSLLSVISSFFLKIIGRNMNAFALKFISDYLFIIVEKIVVKLPSLLLLYITYYEDIVDKEINIAKITKQDNVLHIGCGSLPSTSLLIAQKTRAPTIGIDKNIPSVQDAQNCIHALHLENQIQILHANALTYTMQSSDVIIVSQGIEPRYQVLEHIANTMRPNTRVIFRTFSSKNDNLTNEDAVLSTLFFIQGIVTHPQHGILISVLLKKKTEE
jgi:D-arabinose 1-dehydrogenase-like Zn-dependent alcohol dehydrogenase